MASGMVPIHMMRDQSVTAAEVLVYLAVSVRSGGEFDVSEVANLAKLGPRETERAILSLLKRGDLEAQAGCLNLGPLGGGS